jgi:hypothetical protein
MKIQGSSFMRLWVTVGVLGLAFAAPAHAAPGSDLNKADWLTVIKNDTALQHPAEEPFGPDRMPFVIAPGKVQGHAAYKDVKVGDISGDGKPEALVPLSSGGTGGDIGLLVYTEGRGGAPVFVTALGGYKMSGQPENGRLTVRQPVYVGWEANCCPSGLETAQYRLRGARLQRLSASVEGFPEARGSTLFEYFGRINEKRFREAYAFQSAALQRQNPFARWQAGYAKTSEIQVEDATNSSSERIFAVVGATESGKRVRYVFDARLVWSARAKQWLIAELRAQPIPVDAALITGALGYPSSGIPPLLLVARGAGGAVVTTTTKLNQGAYWMIVPAGAYTVMAYPQDTPSGNALGGGYTQATPCGLSAECTDHTLITVNAIAGQTSGGADPTDWYAPDGALPAKP